MNKSMEMENQECIRYEDVSKVYHQGTPYEKIALDRISLMIRQGEFIGIAGMNGSGKSTFARLLNGLIQPTSGRVLVNGMDTSDKKSLKKIRSLIGMLFQNPDNQIISPIVEEDVAFGPANLGLPNSEIKERVDWALKVLNMGEYRHHSPHMLSGGQKQRVAIASALAMRPSCLVLDEPTSMLDTMGRRELLSTLKLLNNSYHITILLVSHHMEDMAHVNRLIVFGGGRIRHDAPPWELFSCPEKLGGAGINPPEIAALLNSLRKRGLKLDEKLMTTDQIEEFVCRQLK